MKRKAVILSDNPSAIYNVYGEANLSALRENFELYPGIIPGSDLQTEGSVSEFLKETSFIFSTWGFPSLTAEQLDLFPKLEVIFYAAGSIRGFAEPFLKRGVKVVSAWQANAVPVAEFSLAQILLSMKGYFRNTADCRTPAKRLAGDCTRGPGLFGETVGLIGCGMIARLLIGYLKTFNLKLLVYDPFLSDEDAKALGVSKRSLEELFASSFVISNHLPDLAGTRGMLGGGLFRSMRHGASFINTGRGAQIVESEFLEVMKERQDLTALLDVTYPEPPAADSDFYTLQNVQLSSHIAGSMNDELRRMSAYVLDDLERYLSGENLKYSVTLEMFAKMA